MSLLRFVRKVLVLALACYGGYSLYVHNWWRVPDRSTPQYQPVEFQATHRWTARETVRWLTPLIKWRIDPSFPFDAEVEKLVLFECGMDYAPEGHLYVEGVDKPYRFVLGDLVGTSPNRKRNRVSFVLERPDAGHYYAMR